MDVIDLWELLSYAGDWSFETFPWDLFSLCCTKLNADSSILPNSQSNKGESCLPSQNCIVIQNGELPDAASKHSISPTADVPSFEVSYINHSNQNSNHENHDSAPTGDDQKSAELVEESADSDHGEQPGEESLVIEVNKQLNTLEESIAVLHQSVEERTALAAFEKLSKKNPDLTVDVAKLPENAQKNRYKDVLPYDCSRVPLAESKTGDYINASFVKMEIPPLNLQHEYIAAQGPLPHTCDDFWQMIWEQNCCIIVMVTTLKERNRVKCHKYWPDLYEMVTYAGIQITCFHETTTQAGITRDLLLANKEKDEERHIIQMQYVAWPDHGVPEDATDFLDFVQQLREWRKLIGGTVVVHCSAGVGRTGVFILMETTMCLIEGDHPVYPLELVKSMRDQRMMMVQTVGQYKFICEAILKLYSDHENSISGTSASR